jgi:predicted dehydrogenase/nucleoside-diphosphate-sugar epimerase
MGDLFSQSTPRTMLITGASGFIGSRLTNLALIRGYSVKTLTRSDWNGSPFVPAGQRYFGSFPGDIPMEALQGIDVVVHCAASIDTDEEKARAVNVEGTTQLSRLAAEAGVQTFIFLSSQSARPDALSAYGKTKYQAEQALLTQNELNIIVLRPGLVTGSGSRGLYQRMSGMVDRLPLLPLLGGGKSIVQPIHVDDLCEAIFRCDVRGPQLRNRILSLGHPQGISLADFLQKIAVARLGRRRPVMSVPLWPVELGARLAETVGISLPINTGNLKALKVVEKMETEADLAELNLTLRPLEEMISYDETVESSAGNEVSILLVGAGRIGLVHALTMSRLAGVKLCGIVDPNARAKGLLQGMGVSARMFESLDQAFAETSPQAVVIATPPSTHLRLARTCLERGLAVMIEKPLAVQEKQLAEYEVLEREFPTVPIFAGYVMPRNPQVSELLDQLRAGHFGRVRGFIGVTLLSLIQESGSKRWEVNQSISGGGALINSGGHVLSMIHAAFGEPVSVEGQSLKLYSSEVEDSIVLNLAYDGFKGTHYCSWSINGHARQENRLVISTDEGELILTGSVGVFVNKTGEVDLAHQLDFDVGFNLAPDYAGAGFTNELNILREAALTGDRSSVNLKDALQLERLIFTSYEKSVATKSFKDDGSGLSSIPSEILKFADLGLSKTDKPVRRILDLRDSSAAEIVACWERPGARERWDEYLISPGPFAKLSRSSSKSIADENLRISVPDFLNQSRLLSTGRFGEVLRQMGVGGVAKAIRETTPTLARERSLNFWVAATGMLAAALHSVPFQFRGTLLLHTYLTDLALTLRQVGQLQRMLAMCRRLRPHARIGFQTNLAAEALGALRTISEPVDEVSALTSPRGLRIPEIFAELRRKDKTGKLRLTAEVGLAPAIVHQVAYDAAPEWAHGADALLIGTGADTFLAEQRRLWFEQEWSKVFPGLSVPNSAL